jgi:hypothetical protein
VRRLPDQSGHRVLPLADHRRRRASRRLSELPPLRDDGLPTLPTGEPVLQRWFVIALLVGIPVAIAVTIWAFASIPRDEIAPADRRPPGGPQITIDRGDAELGASVETEAGPACAQAIELLGDSGTRATSRRALGATCELLRSGRYPTASEGLAHWIRNDGLIRVAIFELSGVEGSARMVDDRLVVELNAKYQFEDATRAAPELVHQLTLIGQADWPGRTLTADAALEAAEAQADACTRLSFAGAPPRGCRDVEELLAADDPRTQLIEAGYLDS